MSAPLRVHAAARVGLHILPRAGRPRHRNGPPRLFAAFERGDPEFGRGQVDVAGAQPQGLADAAPGVREGARECLQGRSPVDPDRGEESLVLVGRQVFPAVVVDERHLGRPRRHASVSTRANRCGCAVPVWISATVRVSKCPWTSVTTKSRPPAGLALWCTIAWSSYSGGEGTRSLRMGVQ